MVKSWPVRSWFFAAADDSLVKLGAIIDSALVAFNGVKKASSYSVKLIQLSIAAPSFDKRKDSLRSSFSSRSSNEKGMEP